jgi:hypothetical protein
VKILSLKLNDKTYMTGKITAFLSKEALKIQKESLALAKKGQAMQSEEGDKGNQVEEADELLTSMLEINEKKSWLICEVYQNKFSTNDLENYLSNADIDEEINKILYGITGIISKN